MSFIYHGYSLINHSAEPHTRVGATGGPAGCRRGRPVRRRGRREDRVPYSGIRRTTDEAMERLKYPAPHITTMRWTPPN